MWMLYVDVPCVIMIHVWEQTRNMVDGALIDGDAGRDSTPVFLHAAPS
jgi:hypothetical protein